MGFIFNFHTNKVCNPIELKKPPQQKFKDPKIFPKNVNLNNINNFIVFDLEPDSIIYNTNTKNEIHIPNIREWSFVHVKTKYHFKLTNVVDNTISFVTNYSYSETINMFCKYYKLYNYPYIIAHNGYRFDFLVLVANIYRYVKNPEEIVKNMKFYDSYVYIKDLKIKNCSYSNISLFQRYLMNYKKYEYLQYRQHNSLEDCQMLTLWFGFLLN